AWRSGPAAVTVERPVVGWLAQAIGCAGFRGSLTGGGSSANLMGLAMAREAKMPANEAGSRGAPQAVIYASEEVHMSIPKSVALLGIGRKNLRLIAVDKDFRMTAGRSSGRDCRRPRNWKHAHRHRGHRRHHRLRCDRSAARNRRNRQN